VVWTFDLCFPCVRCSFRSPPAHSRLHVPAAGSWAECRRALTFGTWASAHIDILRVILYPPKQVAVPDIPIGRAEPEACTGEAKVKEEVSSDWQKLQSIQPSGFAPMSCTAD